MTRTKNIKKLKLSIITLDGKCIKKIVKTPPRKIFTADGIERMLLSLSQSIEKDYPDADFRLVPLGPAEFKFIQVVKE
jgi:hypothetical protein